MPDKITIEDLEVHFHVGVPDEERAKPQKLLITIEMTKDLRPSAANDNLTETIDYFAVNQAVKALGQARRWKLIEALADDLCELVLCTFKPSCLHVQGALCTSAVWQKPSPHVRILLSRRTEDAAGSSGNAVFGTMLWATLLKLLCVTIWVPASK